MWERLPTHVKGMLLAHEIHKNMRDHYHTDVMNKGKDRGGRRDADKPEAPWTAMRKKFFESDGKAVGVGG